MSNIDWSKAPEWAGAVVNSASGNLYWVEEFGVKSRRQSFDSSEPDEHYIADMTLPDHGWRLVEVRTPHWTGTGLPPVGTVCEVDYCEKWCRCEVIAHFQQSKGIVAAFTVNLGDSVKALDAFGAEYFRPIRTPEQIAAEEREKAVSEMAETLQIQLGTNYRDDLARLYCFILHDADFRKTEAP